MTTHYLTRLKHYIHGLITYRSLSLPPDAMTDPDIQAGRELGHLLTGYRNHPDPDPLRPMRSIRSHVIEWPLHSDEITVQPRQSRPHCPRCHGNGELYDERDRWLLLACPCTAALLQIPTPGWIARHRSRRRIGRPASRLTTGDEGDLQDEPSF